MSGQIYKGNSPELMVLKALKPNAGSISSKECEKFRLQALDFKITKLNLKF